VGSGVERGRIVRNDGFRTAALVELDSGEQLSFTPTWEMGHLAEDRRVLVTRRGKMVVQIVLDLSPIGLTEGDARHFDRVRTQLDEMLAKGALTAEQREMFEALLELDVYGAMGKEGRMLRDRLERGLAGDHLRLSSEDPWAALARQDISASPHRATWLALIELAGDGSKPTKKWLKTVTELVGTLGTPVFVEHVRRWFAKVAPRPVTRDESNWFTPAMVDANSDALRNLVWACSTVTGERETETLAVLVGDLAVRCFTKIPGVGALSTRAGNACIYVLSQLPGLRAVAQLSRLGSRLRYRKAIALVEKAKAEAAKRAGMEPIDLEELALPTFGLDVTGRTRIPVGAYEAELAVAGEDVTLTWYGGGKRLKSMPAAVKANAEELAELKATHKELAALVPTLRYQLERWMMEPREWTLADLRTRYLDHPLAAALSRRLIYVAGTRAVIFLDGYPLGVNGKQLELADDTMLSLWHPLGRPASEIAAWQKLLASLGVTQPIKQLEREIYAADAKAASRFAGKVVRQHQFAALCRERGWTYRLQGNFDSANTPSKSLSAYGLEIELEAEPAGNEVAGSGIFVHLRTGNVRFSRNGKTVKPGDVPPRCFSEAMRDVDLLVTVGAR
jgi:hypothetical protein